MVHLKDVTTRWHLILDVVEQGTPSAREAFEKLIGVYWSPVFTFVRRWLDEEEARDLTQSFFTRLLETNDVGKFVEKNSIRCMLENNELGRSPENAHESRSRGWFRFWLRVAARNHLIRYWKQQQAQIYGGRFIHVSRDDDTLDQETRCHIEPTHETSPERLYARVHDPQRGHKLIARVDARVRADPAYRDEPEFFEALKQFISGDTDELQRETAARFGKTPGAVRKAVFDFKIRYRKYLDAALAESGGGVEHIKEERRKLLEAVTSDD